MQNELLLSSNVPDPSDFPPTNISPGLRNLDSTLRCTICGELFDAPVTLPCGHCFCSFCVRTAMAEKQECPGCRKNANELHLRPNPGMEEVVAAWKLSRPYILRLSKDDEGRRLPRNNGSLLVTPNAKKRKIAAEVEGVCRIKDRPFPSSSSSSGPPSSPLKPTRRRKPAPEADDLEITTIPTSDADENELDISINLDCPRPDDQIPCPVCNKNVVFKNINSHIDRGCKDLRPDSARSNRSEWEKIMRSNKGKQKESDDVEDERLPKVSYGPLKDKKLREMLADHNLPTHGDRNLLIQRHQRWVMLFNANLDRSASTRKSKTELREELKKWEDGKTKKKKNVVEDGVTHEKRHRGEFDNLVKAARVNKTARRSTPPLVSSGLSTNIDEKSSPVRRSSPNEDTIVVDSEEEREG